MIIILVQRVFSVLTKTGIFRIIPVEYSDQSILFFYGHYFMNITNWSEDGRPVPGEYPIYLIAEKLLNCSGPDFDWQGTPYSNFQNMVAIYRNVSLPKRYVIPPDKNLARLFTFLEIVIVSVKKKAFTSGKGERI
uniref:Uncharacterized protein n=1 Tax=Tetranychus urticae TaxID=32264 RepID=T1KRB6_TETUR